MSVVLSPVELKKEDVEMEVDLEKSGLAQGEAHPACTVRVQREGLGTFVMYVMFMSAMAVVFRQFSDRDFSSILTVGAAVNCFGFAILLYKVRMTASVAGLSARSLEMYALFYAFRLTSTCQKNGYIPVDRSGDWLYQTFDACAWLLVLQLLYAVHVLHRDTYQVHLDLSVEYLRAVPLLITLGFFLHGDLNHNVSYDIIWQISLNFATFALVPQLYLMYKLPKVEALNAHYVAAITLGNFCAFLFWFWGFNEIGPEEGKASLGGWVVIACHTLMLLQSAEFMIKYLRVVLTNGHEDVLNVLDKK